MAPRTKEDLMNKQQQNLQQVSDIATAISKGSCLLMLIGISIPFLCILFAVITQH